MGINQAEAESCMAWLDRRLVIASYYTIPSYVKVFKREWEEHVGPLDTIPSEYKDKVMSIYRERKGREMEVEHDDQ